MTTVFIFHGTGGHPNENWFPWLKEELQKLDCKVIVPKFPTPEGQTLTNWLKVFDNYKSDFDKDTIFVGHSCGASFILNLLKVIDTKIHASFLVSGSAKLLHNKFDKLSSSFKINIDDWDRIKSNSKQFFVYHSDTDPYVPLSYGQEIADSLHTSLTLILDAGHINTDSGFLKFPKLLDDIKSVL